MVLLWPGVDRLAEVGADLGLVDVERGDRDDVADVVAAELDVHEAGDRVGRVGVAVVGEALDQRAGAVADAGDREADGAVHRYVSFGGSCEGSGHRLGARRRRGRRAREAMRESSQLMSRATPSAVCWTTERA